MLLGVVVAVWVGACASGPPAESDEAIKGQPAEAGSETSDGKAAESGKPRPPDGFSGVEVLKVVSTAGGHAVILADGDDERVVPIFIGQSQAMAIKLRLQRRRYSRPLTHDLLDDIVAKLDGEIVKVHIDAIKSGVFVGTVYLRGPEQTYQVDARSSDAIALAVGKDAPIFVAEGVFERAGVSREQFDRGGLPRRRRRPPDQSPEPSPDQESGGSEGADQFY